MEKMSLAKRVRALVPPLDPDCGDPACGDCAPYREAEAIVAELERIAEEMRVTILKPRTPGITKWIEPHPKQIDWAAALADTEE